MSESDCHFLQVGGRHLYWNMVKISKIAKNPEAMFEVERELLDAIELLTVPKIETLIDLDFRLIDPPPGFREYLRAGCDGIDPELPFLERHCQVTELVQNFPWELAFVQQAEDRGQLGYLRTLADRARTTATAFAGASGLIRHQRFFDMTPEWLINMSSEQRLAHLEATVCRLRPPGS